MSFHQTLSRFAARVLIPASVAGLVINSAPAQEMSAADRVRASIHAIETLDADYRAVIAIDPNAEALATALDRQRKARGPLYAEPILLKDNIESIGLPTTAGSLALADNYTERDAPLVAQLKSAGAVILGKANLSEWANFRSRHSISGWSAVGGQTRNARDRARTPCGSSAGSAVAVARGYVDIAIGTETSGSIICPAALNGVVGFKPTHGLVSGEGIVPVATSQDTAGPITKDLAGAAKTLAAMSDPSNEYHATISTGLMDYAALEDLEGVRIGIDADSLGFDVRRDAALQAALEVLESRGATLVPGIRIERYPEFSSDSRDVLFYEFKRDLNAYLAALPNAYAELSLDSLILFNRANADREMRYFDQSIFLKAAAMNDSEEVYLGKLSRIREATRTNGYQRLFAQHRLDAVVGITRTPAWMIDTVNGDASKGPSMGGDAAIAGNPHITLPLAEIRGMPLGISLIGKRWEDHRIAQIAHQLERYHPRPIYVSR